MEYILKVVKDTVFKQSTNQSADLTAEDLIEIAADCEFPVSSFSYQQGHLKFSLGKRNGKQASIEGRNTWFAWMPAVQLTKNGKVVNVTPPVATASGSLMIMDRIGRTDQFGAELYKLAWVKAGKEIDWVYVVSGQPGLKAVPREKDYSGSMRPCPAGTYSLGEVEEGHWGSAIGGLWISVDGTEPRQAVGIHQDANRAYSPGSAGCVCPLTESDMRRVAAWRDAGCATLKVV